MRVLFVCMKQLDKEWKSNMNDLIEKAKTNSEILDQILVEYKPLVSSIARRYFLMGAELDDLVQEGMIGLYKAINTYVSDKNASFKTFATLCINSQIKSAVKKANSNKNKVLNQVMLEDNQELMYLVLSTEPNPEDKMINRENFVDMKKEIMSSLSLLEKQILKQYLLGKNYNEIAKTLCIDKKSVDNGLNRIRKKLNHLL